MFNLEIKRIPVKNIVLSAYPFVVFVFTLLSAFLGIGDLIEPGAGFFKALMQILLYSLITMGVIVLFTMLACFIYNLLVSFGMKGLRISLSEVEETSEDSKEEEPKEENNENK